MAKYYYCNCGNGFEEYYQIEDHIVSHAANADGDHFYVGRF
jgi:hypothetical protein